MKVFFVRHGESELTERKFQLPDTQLSYLGQKQANSLAKRFTKIPVDVILSSTYVRALQTAQAIKTVKDIPLIENDLFIERVFPSILMEKNVSDSESISILQMMRSYAKEKDWHHSDEENFFDLLQRAKQALTFIESQEKENVVVVTHGYFLTVMIYVILFGNNFDSRAFRSFREHIVNSNTGLTVCEFTERKWKLLIWNDIAHLGE